MNDKIDLNPDLKRKPEFTGGGAEARALAAMCNFVNDPKLTGLEEKIAKPPPVEIPKATGAASIIVPDAPEPTVTRTLPPSNVQKIFYTGKLGVGKDYLATASGATIFGFADPLYHIAELFFGVEVNSDKGKELPGIRKFLQVIGQWGRGEVSVEYPFTVERGLFNSLIRNGFLDHPTKFSVKWEEFGKNPLLWVEATLSRVDKYLAEFPTARVAITNCRFENEYKALTEAGFTHYHVACSPATWSLRLRNRGLTPDAPVLKDLSEKLAAYLDSDVMKKISSNPRGPKLHCIWNDQSLPAPSGRLLTVAEYLNNFQQ